MKLSDLRVLIDLGGFEPDERYVRPGTRPASVADLVAALIAEGGETIWWCEEHNDAGDESGCAWLSQGNPHRMVEMLLIPVGEKP